MSHLVCIKVGGSVVTDKTKPKTPRLEHIAAFAENLAATLQDHPEVDVIAGNGAGSFGHHSAHEYGLKDGATTTQQFFGTTITHNAVRELNLLVGNALTAHGVPTYCLSPGDVFTATDGEVVSANDAVVETLLHQGSMPLIHGDTVLDTVRGVSIFSTEKSLFWLAKALRGRYDRISIIMVVDTGGVLDEHGTVITTLKRDTAITTAIKIPGATDVTGGMAHKVATCRAAADWADAVYIIGNTRGALNGVLSGKKVGTHVL